MRKHPPDVNVSETCIDANMKMAERWDPDNFPSFQPQERCAWTIPEIALKIICTDSTEILFSQILLKFFYSKLGSAGLNYHLPKPFFSLTLTVRGISKKHCLLTFVIWGLFLSDCFWQVLLYIISTSDWLLFGRTKYTCTRTLWIFLLS